ncbi:SDR family NAD(P)-dependent oxidoreductase [Prauserella flavalba]|uniref:SDR family NAD(P)-dependent oxidoreductase n=1 Tax=Prauserella flavalba TaxID=1477506 RepID=UPI0036ECA224
MIDQETLDGKVAIVTGAGSGIGRATAVALADAGALVLGTGRRAPALAETVRLRHGIRYHVADVRDPASAQEVVAAALATWNRLDVLVNNAAVFASMPLAETDASRVADLLATNITGPPLLAQAALPSLTAAGGAIVNVSSTFGHRPSPGAAHYGASKAAVEHLTRSWAAELAGAGVRVNAVAPGPTESDALAASGLSAEAIEEVKQAERERIPLGRRGEPEEVAKWVVRLAAPGWVTGQVLTVDGGLELT